MPPMPELKGIPVVPEAMPARSGEKYVTSQGFTAIRDGIKALQAAFRDAAPYPDPPGEGPGEKLVR